MDIDDVVRERSGWDSWRIPGDNGKWVRFNCPFCHEPGMKRKDTGAINYELQRFMCFRCGIGFFADDKHHAKNDARLKRILEEHHELIRNVIINVKRKLGNWVTYGELHSRAEELMWGYAFMPPGDPNDAGMLDEWKNYADGDSNKLNDRIASVLWADLMNYADGRANSQRKGGLTHAPEGVTVTSFDEDMPEPSYMAVKPRMRSTGSHEWWLDDLAIAEDLSQPFVVPGCKRLNDGLPPKEGHCPRCDMALT